MRGAAKGKAPLVAAGGVALAGLAAGGLALSRNGRKKSLPGMSRHRRRLHMPHVSMPSLHMPKPDSHATRKALGATAKAFGEVAVEVGKAGYRMGELSAEVRRVRERVTKDD